MKREITLSCPNHPAMAEMVEILRQDVNYHIVGPRFREPVTGVSGAVRRLPLAHRAAAQIRQSGLGAIAYQRVRGALMLRAAVPGRLIHAGGHLIYDDSPWIGEYENVNVLGFYSPLLLHNRRFVEHLRLALSNPACRAIRVWSDSGKRSFHALFQDPEIRRKLYVILPALELPAEALEVPRRTGQPRILFVARGFWVKGGSLFLEALGRLRRQLDFRADFICDLPAECEHYREELAGVVDFYEPGFSRRELYERFYSCADIFVMLGMADSYGLALLEASAFGLPIVAMRLDSGLSDLLRMTGNAIQVEPDHQIFEESGVHCLEADELVRRIRATGETPLIDRIAEALRILISDPDRRVDLGNRGRAAILDGGLSAATMRRSMLELYESVMN